MVGWVFSVSFCELYDVVSVLTNIVRPDTRHCQLNRLVTLAKLAGEWIVFLATLKEDPWGQLGYILSFYSSYPEFDFIVLSPQRCIYTFYLSFYWYLSKAHSVFFLRVKMKQNKNSTSNAQKTQIHKGFWLLMILAFTFFLCLPIRVYLLIFSLVFLVFFRFLLFIQPTLSFIGTNSTPPTFTVLHSIIFPSSIYFFFR